MSNADLNEEPPSSQETTDNITTIAPRRAADFLSPFLYAVAAFAVAVLLFSAVVALAGQNPLAAGQTLVSGAVGSRERVGRIAGQNNSIADDRPQRRDCVSRRFF
jgi:hypothetical protein